MDPSVSVGGSSRPVFCRIPDSDLVKLSQPQLHTAIRRLEQDQLRLISDHGNLMRDINKRMQIHLLEIRGLKEVNQRLQDDCQELRDLCCFLDDDRQRSRKLAREWQRFGRYTSSVMKSEVSAYQEKLNELEQRQDDLVRENIEVKELCLYLDAERGVGNKEVDRDEGDGSSVSSSTHERSRVSDLTPQKDRTRSERSTVNDHTSQYINTLENHIKTLEEQLSQMDIRIPAKDRTTPFHDKSPVFPSSPPSSGDNLNQNIRSPSRPEAIVHAMPSLDVREQLEQISDGRYHEGLNDVEKAVLRSMCKVAKKRLDNGPSPQKLNPLDSTRKSQESQESQDSLKRSNSGTETLIYTNDGTNNSGDTPLKWAGTGSEKIATGQMGQTWTGNTKQNFQSDRWVGDQSNMYPSSQSLYWSGEPSWPSTRRDVRSQGDMKWAVGQPRGSAQTEIVGGSGRYMGPDQSNRQYSHQDEYYRTGKQSHPDEYYRTGKQSHQDEYYTTGTQSSVTRMPGREYRYQP